MKNKLIIKQQGMTLIGMLLVMIVTIVFIVFIMRITPVYLQHYSIMQSVKSLNTTPFSSLSGDTSSDLGLLRTSLTKRFDMNGVEDLKGDELVITPVGENKYIVKSKYRVIRPLIYNMSILFDFDDTQEVKVGSEN